MVFLGGVKAYLRTTATAIKEGLANRASLAYQQKIRHHLNYIYLIPSATSNEVNDRWLATTELRHAKVPGGIIPVMHLTGVDNDDTVMMQKRQSVKISSSGMNGSSIRSNITNTTISTELTLEAPRSLGQ